MFNFYHSICFTQVFIISPKYRLWVLKSPLFICVSLGQCRINSIHPFSCLILSQCEVMLDKLQQAPWQDWLNYFLLFFDMMRENIIKYNVFLWQLMFILIRLGRPSERVDESGRRAGVYSFTTPTNGWKVKVPNSQLVICLGFLKKQTNNNSNNLCSDFKQPVFTSFRFLNSSEPVVPNPDSWL